MANRGRTYDGKGHVSSNRSFRLTGKTFRWYVRMEGDEEQQWDLWFRPEDVQGNYKHRGLSKTRRFNKMTILEVEELPD